MTDRRCKVCGDVRPRGCVLTCGRSGCLMRVTAADYDLAYCGPEERAVPTGRIRAARAKDEKSCKACETRARRGFQGQCPACANERSRAKDVK